MKQLCGYAASWRTKTYDLFKVCKQCHCVNTQNPIKRGGSVLFCVVIQINISLTSLDDMSQNVFTSYTILSFMKITVPTTIKVIIQLSVVLEFLLYIPLKVLEKTQNATTQQSKGLVNKNYAVFDFDRINK